MSTLFKGIREINKQQAEQSWCSEPREPLGGSGGPGYEHGGASGTNGTVTALPVKVIQGEALQQGLEEDYDPEPGPSNLPTLVAMPAIAP